MDIAARLIVFLVLAVWSQLAFAVGTVVMEERDVYGCKHGHTGKTGEGGSAKSACQAAWQSPFNEAVLPDGQRQSMVLIGSVGACDLGLQKCMHGGLRYNCTRADGSDCGSYSVGADWYFTDVYVRRKQRMCPDNSIAMSDNIHCECALGTKAVGNTCERYACPAAGSYSAVTQPDQKVPNAGDSVCSGGCSFVPSSWKVGEDGQIWATWPFKSAAKFCGGDKAGSPPADSGEKNSQNPAPVPCGANQCPGTVNGATICVPCKGQQEKGPETSASAPEGAASGAGGSSSTTTECNGVTCTTTTTTRDGSGAVTGVAEKTEKQESFCKENPQSSLCKQSSFAGSCAATTCEGDAVMCALAREQAKRNCEWFEDSQAGALRDVGTAHMTGQAQPDGHPAKAADGVAVAFASSIDQSDALGGPSCPTDITFTLDVPLVGARSVGIAFGQMCDSLRLAGNAGVAIALLWAGLFVFRGVS